MATGGAKFSKVLSTVILSRKFTSSGKFTGKFAKFSTVLSRVILTSNFTSSSKFTGTFARAVAFENYTLNTEDLPANLLGQ
jgi:hypothetical protein